MWAYFHIKIYLLVHAIKSIINLRFQVKRISPRRGRLCDLRRCTMTPIISAAPTSTTASTEKLVMAASFHTSGVSSTDLPVNGMKRTGTLNHCVMAESSLIYIFRVRFTLLHVLHEGVLGYCLHDAHGTQTSKSEFQNSELPH